VLSALVNPFRHSLIVGNVGVGKTMIAQSVLANLPEGRASMTINFSAQTSSNSLQDTIEGKLEKRTKGVFAPAGGKKLVCYIDDFNMPKKSVFGFMPPLELVRRAASQLLHKAQRQTKERRQRIGCWQNSHNSQLLPAHYVSPIPSPARSSSFGSITDSGTIARSRR
jgi:ABC-type dipeptide/oligopeptide/nickel transport system ATPase component